MKIIHGIDSLPTLGQKRFGVAIGNFDGFHLGHQKIISKMLGFCNEHNINLIIMTFVPHPRIILHGEKHFLINDYQERRKFMEKFHVKALCEINFSRQFSELSPGDFLDKYILKEKGIKHFFLGHDFSFGKDKKGDRVFVEKYCRDNDVSVEIFDEFRPEEKISSSHIRSLLKGGNIKKANEFLGRKFFLKGRIVHGSARGKSIGFPTANLDLSEDLLIPGNGVYATKVIDGEKSHLSLTNVGYNPTLQKSSEISIETHILGFEKNIYGEDIKIIFVDKIREEQKFPSAERLREQIEKDVAFRRSGSF